MLLTVMAESVFITAVINAHKGRKVACFDILRAFLHANVDKDIPWSSRADWQS
jgi:hypothetical protein